MGFFQIYDANDVDQELYERVWNRYIKIYPEAEDPDFEPNFSGHDEDWDRIWDEEYVRLEKERFVDETGDKNESVEGEYEDPDIYGPDAKLPPKKKKKKKTKQDDESTGTTEPCPGETHENADTCFFKTFTCKINDGTTVSEIKFFDDNDNRTRTEPIGVACDRKDKKGGNYKISFALEGYNGACDVHKGSIFYIYGNNYEIVDQSDAFLEIKVYSTHDDEFKELWYDLQLEHVPEKIRVVMEQCGKHEEVEIWVMPKYSIDLDINIKFKDKESPTDYGYRTKGDKPLSKYKEKAPTYDQMKETPEERKFILTRNFNGNKDEWGLKFGEKKIKDLDRFSAILDKFFNFANDWFSTFAKVTIVMPMISAKGTWSHGSTDDFATAKLGSYTLAASPILGFSFELSLVKSGFILGGALGRALDLADKVKVWTNGAVDIQFDITVTIGGSMSAEIKENFGQKIPRSMSFVTSLQLILAAKASVGFNACIFKASASGTAAATAKFATTFSVTGIFLPRGSYATTFGGLDLTLVCAYEVGIGWISYGGEVNAKYTVVDACTLWSLPFDMN